MEGGALIKGAVRGGGMVREDTPLRAGFYTFGWTGFALVSLVAAILVTFIVRPFSTTAAASPCVPGSIVVAGSTAFAPSVVAVAQRLRQQCPSSGDGTPASGTLLAAFIAYMSTDTAKSVLQNYGNIPCSFTPFCP